MNVQQGILCRQWADIFLVVRWMLLMIVNVMADVVLSTAHKAKGLEFDTVQLTDDFMWSNDGMMLLFSARLKQA